MVLNGTCTNQNLIKRMTHKIHWDFEIQTDYLIPVKRLNSDNLKKEKESLPYSGVKIKESE